LTRELFKIDFLGESSSFSSLRLLELFEGFKILKLLKVLTFSVDHVEPALSWCASTVESEILFGVNLPLVFSP